MSLDTSGDAYKVSEEYQLLLKAGGGLGNDRSFLDILQTILDDGFQQAEPTILDIDISVVAGSLFIPLGKPNEMAMNIAQACAEYWFKAIGFGEPEKDEVLEVINDAMKIIDPIVQKLHTIYNPSVPYYELFINTIHTEVKTIIWTVTESDSVGNEYTFEPQVM